MTASCVYQSILSCSDHLFYRAPLGNCLFHKQVAGFQPPDTGKKVFHKCFSSILYKNKNSYSKAFIYLKLLKFVCEEVNLQ